VRWLGKPEKNNSAFRGPCQQFQIAPHKRRLGSSLFTGKRQERKLEGSYELKCVRRDKRSKVMLPTLKRQGAILPVEAGEGK
jgi:hypothetical protein